MSSITVRCPHCHKLNRIPAARVDDLPNCGACKHPLLIGKPIEGTTENFQALLASSLPIVIDFWAPWCGPCQGFASVFEQTANRVSRSAIFVKVNTEEQEAIASQFQIRSIPTIMVFKNGNTIQQVNGALPQSDFDLWLNQVL